MPEQPLISMIIPAYNTETHIGAAVAGALSQTYTNTEVIVVNDGSTDRTRQVLEGFGDMIRVVDKPNGGVSSARNEGAAVAKGDLLAFIDADDIVLPGYLQAMADARDEAGSGRWWIYSQAYFFAADGIDLQRPVVWGRYSAEEQRLVILERNIAGPPASLVSKQMHQEIGGFDTGMRSPEDWDYWARAIYSGWVGQLQTRPFYLYRWSDSSLSNDFSEMLAGEDRIMQKLRDLFWNTMSPQEQDHLQRRLTLGSPNRLVALGNTALRQKDYRRAADLFQQAASLAPHDRKLWIKARSMRLSPVAHFWRARRVATDKTVRRFDYSAQDTDALLQEDQ